MEAKVPARRRQTRSRLHKQGSLSLEQWKSWENAGTLETRGKQRRTGNETTGTHRLNTQGDEEQV